MTAIIKKQHRSGKHVARNAILLLLLVAFATTGFKGSPTSRPVTGEELYKHNCSRCHGADGTRGFFGAKNLKKSQLSDPEVVQQIQQGKGIMPSFRKKFTPGELNEVLLYIKGLRKN